MSEFTEPDSNFPEYNLQNRLLLSLVSDRHQYAADVDMDNRLGFYSGIQYFLHNTPDIKEPPMSKLYMKPAGFDEQLHNVREIYIYTPEDQTYWEDDNPMFCFIKAISTQGREFTLGVSASLVQQFKEGTELSARLTFNDSGFFEVDFGETDENRQLDAIVDKELGVASPSPEYYEGMVAALNECITHYRLFTQSIDRRIP